jgi:hypothetical protein
MREVPVDFDLFSEFKKIGCYIESTFEHSGHKFGETPVSELDFPDGWTDEQLRLALMAIQAHRGDLRNHVVVNYDKKIIGDPRNDAYKRIKEVLMQTGFMDAQACSVLMSMFYKLYESIYSPGSMDASPEASVNRRIALMHKVGCWETAITGYAEWIGDASDFDRIIKEWDIDTTP